MKKVIYAAGILSVLVAVVLAYQTRANAQDNTGATRAPLLSLVGPGSSIGVTVRDGDTGVVVQDVRGDSPASRAGLMAGDIVTDFDGERTRSAAQFTRLVRETAPSRTVKIGVVRGGKPITMDISPDARGADDLRFPNLTRDFQRNLERLPRDFAFDFDFSQPGFNWYSPRRLGITVTPLSDQLAGYFGVKQGVLVSEVAAGSAGEAAGIKAGDVITAVRGQAVSQPNDVTRELHETDSGNIEIRVTRERREMTLTAKIPERPRALSSRGRPI